MCGEESSNSNETAGIKLMRMFLALLRNCMIRMAWIISHILFKDWQCLLTFLQLTAYNTNKYAALQNSSKWQTNLLNLFLRFRKMQQTTTFHPSRMYLGNIYSRMYLGNIYCLHKSLFMKNLYWFVNLFIYLLKHIIIKQKCNVIYLFEGFNT